MARILSYGCTSSAGPTTSHFWDHLIQGKINTDPRWSFHLNDGDEKKSSQEVLTQQLCLAWDQAKRAFNPDQAFGVILASTKGCIDDFIWNQERPEKTLALDSITPVLESFLKAAELSPAESICVSNACASSHAALFLGAEWIRQGRVKQVLVLACDRVGDFVLKGFQSLHALTENIPKPFAAARDGLKLGEAAAAILLGTPSHPDLESYELRGVGLNTEGYAVTRPSPSGESLKRAFQQLKNEIKSDSDFPDFIIAHGTATKLNDSTEDKIFTELFSNQSIPVSGTKWCIGHTLAASGAMDVIAACQAIKTRQLFSLASTIEIDPAFHAHYLDASKKSDSSINTINRVLVSSLGFGGIHAMTEIAR